MTEETIVAVYDSAAHADAAVRDLEAAGVPTSAISRQSGTTGTTGSMTTAEPVREKGFWSSLFGGDTGHDESVYDRSLSEGSSIVTVRVPEDHVKRVTDILEMHSPVDVDERAAAYGVGGTSATTTTTTSTAIGGTAMAGGVATAAVAGSDKDVLALSEEQLVVGKRLVNRGTTRIRRFVVETPVEESVSLHSEKVTIERRPVAPGTKVTDVDFTDRTIEVTETAEEAVVGKTAHVREEVVINKVATDRVETVRDTVRREDVEIVKEAATTTTGTTSTTGVIPDGVKPTRPGV